MAKDGLGKWFAEKWVDVKTGKACGRSGPEKQTRGYPACRPEDVAKQMTPAEKKAMAAKKTSSARQSWPVSASGKRKRSET